MDIFQAISLLSSHEPICSLVIPSITIISSSKINYDDIIRIDARCLDDVQSHAQENTLSSVSMHELMASNTSFIPATMYASTSRAKTPIRVRSFLLVIKNISNATLTNFTNALEFSLVDTIIMQRNTLRAVDDGFNYIEGYMRFKNARFAHTVQKRIGAIFTNINCPDTNIAIIPMHTNKAKLLTSYIESLANSHSPNDVADVVFMHIRN